MGFDAHQNIKDSIKTLFFEPCVAEVRVIKAGKLGTVSGYFELPEQIDAVVEACEERSGKYNVYWTINPVHPDLLARACNRTKPYSVVTTEDTAIVKRIWLPIDFDPVRFAGISSSGEEKESAKKLMAETTGWLTECGWPRAVKANSGNGYHGLYRIDLPNDDASRDLCKLVLESLSARFSTTMAKVDTTLYNAARILKAYGTVATKGDFTPTRPHRYSMLTIPKFEMEIVTLEQLQAVAAMAPKDTKKKGKAAGEGGWTQELVEAGLNAAKVKFRAPVSFKDGLKWQHNCWHNPDHKSPDAFTCLDGSGWVSFCCSHDSCGAGMNSREWVDAVEELGGKKIEKPKYCTRTKEEIMAKYRADELKLQDMENASF